MQSCKPGTDRCDELVPRTASVLPVARACQARCPFCFSKASVSTDVADEILDFERIAEVLQQARLRGAERAVITGGGEPSLIGAKTLERLIALAAEHFPKVVLISNGAMWGRAPPDERAAALRRLDAAGLTVLALSRHHFDSERNAQLMRLRTDSDQVASSVAELRRAGLGLRLRWICVLQRGGIDDERAVAAYLDMSAAAEVDEICFKELYVSSSVDSEYHDRDANDWSRRHQVPLALVTDFARSAGWSVVERLPWGAPIFEGSWNGRRVRVAAYTEPSLSWEIQSGVCRSWNLMADGRCLASLEDSHSEVLPRGLRKLSAGP